MTNTSNYLFKTYQADDYIYKAGQSRRWLGNWWRTIPQDVHTYSGLYISSAGNAWSLLSLAGVLKGESYVETVEYNYQ